MLYKPLWMLVDEWVHDSVLIATFNMVVSEAYKVQSGHESRARLRPIGPAVPHGAQMRNRAPTRHARALHTSEQHASAFLCFSFV